MPVSDQSLGRNQYLNYVQRQRQIDKEIAEILRDAAREAGQRLVQMPGDGIGAQVRKFQYANALQGIEQINDGMWDDIGDTIQSAFRTVAEAATDGTEDLMEFLTSNLTDELADNIVGGARNAAERVEARIANDIDIKDTVAKNKALTSGKIDQIINNGLALGQSAREIAKGVMDHIRPDVPGGASFAANRIGRTELNNAFHTAALNNYKRHPWVEAVKWELSGSHSRPDICGEYAEDDKFGLGGGVFPKMAAPMKPHPNCLCYVTPVTPSPAEFQERLLNGEYDDWMEEQGLEPMRGRAPDAAQAPKDLSKVITKDQIMSEREAGLSWAQIADKYGLGNPGAARRAWTQLTGTPHTTSIVPGKPGRKPGVKKKTTTTPKVEAPKHPSVIKPSEALPGDVVKFRPIGFKNDITMKIDRLDNNGWFVGYRASYKNGVTTTRGDIRVFTPSQVKEVRLLKRADDLPPGTTKVDDLFDVKERAWKKHEWVESDTFDGARQQIEEMLYKQSVRNHIRFDLPDPSASRTLGLAEMNTRELNRLGKALEEFFNKFPDTKLNSLVLQKLGGNTYADATSGVFRVRMNTRYFAKDKWSTTMRWKHQSEKASNWKSSPHQSSTVWHELGHIRHYQLDEIVGRYGSEDMISRILEDHYDGLDGGDVLSWMKRYYETGKGRGSNSGARAWQRISDNLSEYGATNHYELVAESYSEVMAYGAKARPLARRIVDAIEERISDGL